MTPAQEAAKAEWERASRQVAQARTTKAGGAGAEASYAVAYDRMAKLGLVARLRGKYRKPT
jgi:hypothetical protein